MELFRRCDLHVHTFHSPCGQPEMLPEVIVRTALERNIDFLAITDHFRPYNDPAVMIDPVREEISRLRPEIKVYIGCEADIISAGRDAITPELIEKTDFIMVSATHFQDPAVSQPKSTDRQTVAHHFLDMFYYAVSLKTVQVIAHPFFVVPDTYDPLAPSLLTEKELSPAIELAVKNKIAMEISRRAVNHPEQTPFLTSFYKLCKEAGLKFSVGNDAHTLKDIGGAWVIEPIVRELGLTDDDLWLPNNR